MYRRPPDPQATTLFEGVKKGQNIIEDRTVSRLYKTEAASGLQPAYNLVTDAGNTFIMNGVMALQK